LIAIVLLAVLAQSPQGSQPPSPSQQPTRFRGGTSLVRLDAFATKNGVPVQDLNAEDFEISEDNAPQKIDTFEHVLIDPVGSIAERKDPASVTAANQQAADPHRRVFVVYLDVEHVDVGGSYDIKQPLIDFMNRVIGADDLVGIMTPDMSANQIAFTRRTQVIEDGLTKNWIWGRRDTLLLSPREQMYENCFPPMPGEAPPGARASALILRSRERRVLESLYDLVRHLEAIRDGRTAVIAVTDGWLLYRPDESLAKVRIDPVTKKPVDPIPGGPPPIGVGPGGTLSRNPANDPNNSDRTECERDQMDLAMTNDDKYFRDLFGEANRANVSFYPIDPRGLVVFDSPLGPEAPPGIIQDAQNLKSRHDALYTLAVNTDGLAMVGSNDLRNEMRRVADDLTSYYLIGYYSTNPKLDGRYRTIKVRSKRPGVEVRARQGYRAASAEEVNAARAAAELVVPEEKAAIVTALGEIETDARAQSRGRAIARGSGEPALFHRGPSTGNKLEPAPARIFPRSDRVHVELETTADSPSWVGAVLDRNGTKTAIPVTVGERTDTASGQRWLTADLILAPLGAGDYVIELSSTAGTEARRTLVAIRVTP
jgi:VWFA-related protein